MPYKSNVPNMRPDLTGTTLHVPPGRWWNDDGWLHLQVEHIADATDDHPLPEGWLWALGVVITNGHADEYCNVPVRADALPPG